MKPKQTPEQASLIELFNTSLQKAKTKATQLLPNDFNALEFSEMSNEFIGLGMNPKYVSKYIIEAIEGAIKCANQ